MILDYRECSGAHELSNYDINNMDVRLVRVNADGLCINIRFADLGYAFMKLAVFQRRWHSLCNMHKDGFPE